MPPPGGVPLQSYPATRFKRIPPPVSSESRQPAKGENHNCSKPRFSRRFDSQSAYTRHRCCLSKIELAPNWILTAQVKNHLGGICSRTWFEDARRLPAIRQCQSPNVSR